MEFFSLNPEVKFIPIFIDKPLVKERMSLIIKIGDQAMKKLLYLISVFYLNISSAQNYTVYGVTQDLPMGEKDEVIKKNFFITAGMEQGVYPGTKMDVFRTLFVINGFNSMEKINHRVKIGELRVIHAENQAAVAVIENLSKGEKDLVLDFRGFRIGDQVSPKVSSK